MSDLTDKIANDLRDYVVDGNPGSGDYTYLMSDLRDILTTMALGEQWIDEVQTFLNAADVGDALTGIGLGEGDSVVFTDLTLSGDLVVDTTTLVVDALNSRVGVGTATPAVTLDVSGVVNISEELEVTGDVAFLADLDVDDGTLLVDSTNNRVGVLVASPTVALDVLGEVLVTSDDTTNPALEVIMTGTAAVAKFALSASDTNPPLMILDTGTSIFGYSVELDDGIGLTPVVQVHGIVDSTNALAIFQWGGAGLTGATISLNRSRGNLGASGIVSEDDVLGMISFSGDDGTTGPDFVEAGRFTCEVDAGPAADDMPGRFVWLLTPDGDDTPAEVMRISSSGLLSLAGDSTTGWQRPAENEWAFLVAGTEAMRIDADRKVLIGAAEPYYSWSGLPGFQLTGSDFNSPAHLLIHRISDDSTGAYLSLQKSKGTPGAEADVDAANTLIGSIGFVGRSTDDDYYRGALIQVESEDAWTGANAPSRMRFYTCSAAGSLTERLRIDTAGLIYPGQDNAQSLGTGSRRWSTVYAATGTINTSDANEKQQLAYLTEDELAVAKDAARAIRTFKWNDAVAAKGSAARTHVSPTAQSIYTAFAAHGLDASHYGLWCQDVIEGGAIRQGVRSDQLALFMIAGLEARVTALENA